MDRGEHRRARGLGHAADAGGARPGDLSLAVAQHGEVEHQRIGLDPGDAVHGFLARQPHDELQLEPRIRARDGADRELEEHPVEGRVAGDEIDLARRGHQRETERDRALDVQDLGDPGRPRRAFPALERALDDAIEDNGGAWPQAVAVLGGDTASFGGVTPVGGFCACLRLISCSASAMNRSPPALTAKPVGKNNVALVAGPPSPKPPAPPPATVVMTPVVETLRIR